MARRRIKTIKFKDKTWGLDYTCVFSIRHRERAINNREARKLEDQRANEKATGICEVCRDRKERSKGLKVSLKFRDIAGEFIEWERIQNKKTLWRDEYSLKPLNLFLGDMLITNIKARDIDRYRIDRLKVVKPGTILRELSFLKRLFNVCLDIWEIKGIERNPVKTTGLKENKRLTYITPEEIGQLEDYCYKQGILGLLLITGIQTGLRKSNLFNLRWDHNLRFITSLKHGEIIEISIPENESKNKQAFTTYIMDKKLIGRIKELRANSDDYVFTNKKTGKPFKDLRHFLKKALIESGLLKEGSPDRIKEGFCFHSIRHSWATRLSKMNVNTQALMKAGNWKTPAMAFRYSHLDNEDVQDTLALQNGKPEKVSTTLSTFDLLETGEGLK